MNAVIDVKCLIKIFSGTSVLRELDLRVERGTTVGLLGTNGAGKSTLIKCLVGLLRRDSGACSVLGEDSFSLSPAAKARIGYVPQVISFMPWLKGWELIAYTASFYPRWNQALSDRLAGEWSIPLEQRVGTLSVGQTQKLAILLAVAYEPELLILDEPAAALDPLARRQFLQFLIDVASPGERTILFSTHLTTDLERVADHVAVMKAGRFHWVGPLEELKEQTHLNLEESFLEMHNG